MKRVAIITAVLAVVLLVSCSRAPQSTTPAGASSEGFAIYLTAQDIPVSQMPALSHVQLAEEPLLSLADILSYDWNTHEIELTAEGAAKVNRLEVPTSGKTFVICVDRQPIYWGAFWAGYSSASFDGITIMVQPLLPGPHAIRVGLGYPSEGFYEGIDPRSDPRIKASLEEAGKLTTPQTTLAPGPATTGPITRERAIEIASRNMQSAVLTRAHITAELRGWYWEVVFDDLNASSEEMMPYPLGSFNPPPPLNGQPPVDPWAGKTWQTVIVRVDAETGSPNGLSLREKVAETATPMPESQAIEIARQKIASFQKGLKRSGSGQAFLLPSQMRWTNDKQALTPGCTGRLALRRVLFCVDAAR